MSNSQEDKSLDGRSLEKKFSKAAQKYLNTAYVQKAVAARLVELIPQEIHPKRILEVGCGPGVLTGLLLQRFAEAEIDCLDLSPEMLQHLSSEFASPRINLIQGNFLDEGIKLQTYDLIISSSSMHWFNPLSSAFEKVEKLLSSGGIFLVALMVEGTLKELRELRASLFPKKKNFLDFHSADDISKSLKSVGLELVFEENRPYIESHNDPFSFFRSLSDRGVTASSGKENQLSRGELLALAEQYQNKYGSEKEIGVPATYQVVTTVLKKA